MSAARACLVAVTLAAATGAADEPPRGKKPVVIFVPTPQDVVEKMLGAAKVTKADLSCIAPMPSIRQSISWSPSTRRMLRTFVPTFTTEDEPLIFRSLVTVTESPSCRIVPSESLVTRPVSSASAAAPGGHS